MQVSSQSRLIEVTTATTPRASLGGVSPGARLSWGGEHPAAFGHGSIERVLEESPPPTREAETPGSSGEERGECSRGTGGTRGDGGGGEGVRGGKKIEEMEGSGFNAGKSWI